MHRMQHPPPRLGASREVIRHHAAEHQRACRCEEVEHLACPCGTTIKLVCDRGWIVFVVVDPGTYCQHARDVLEPVGAR